MSELSKSTAADGSSRLIAIGDVHGCIHALDAVLEAIAPTTSDQLVFLGDLIDQGANTCEVLDRLLELKRQTSVVLIQGNHEELMFAARENEPALLYWAECGGVATLNSYRFGGGLADIPGEHWSLLRECLPYYETDRFIFTHANYAPDLPMPEQPGFQLRWSPFDPDAMRPHRSGKPVFVGHTEQLTGDVVDLGFALCLDTACWRYGWLTAMDVSTGQTWQASRWGVFRDADEPTNRTRLSHFLIENAKQTAPVY